MNYDKVLTEEIKDMIKKDYIENFFSIRDIAKKYNIKSKEYLCNKLLKGHVRNYSEASKIAHRLNGKERPLEEILVEHSTYDNTVYLRMKLFCSGLKEQKCECCGLTEWYGKPIPLQLHHINGVHDDNRLENLQILCPNCHSLTENYAGKNLAKKLKPTRKEKFDAFAKVYGYEAAIKFFKKENKLKTHEEKEIKYCIVCGNILKKRQKICCCRDCYNKYQGRRMPSSDDLVRLINSGMTKDEIAEKIQCN